jgi:hypothetical protein
MAASRLRSTRLLPDGTPLRNRLFAALPRADYDRILPYVRMSTVTTGDTLQAHRVPITDVYFPNGGVFSITNEMRNGGLVEVATVGREGMLGIGVFFGDRSGIGRTFQQVADGPLPSMTVTRFVKETTSAGPFRNVVSVYAQASLLQIMQCTACNALHSVTERCSRWLLQTRDLLAQTGIPCGDARRASPDGHGGAADAATRGPDREPLWTNPHPQTKAPGSRQLRMLRRHS